MSQSYKGLTIPSYSDSADGPAAFSDFVDSGPVARFADATARDAAITSPTAGQIVYNIALARFEAYNGTSWAQPWIAPSGGTMSGILDMGNQRIQNLADPINNQDAATRSWVLTQAAAESHNHDTDYAALSHTHSYAAVSHNHAGSNITSGVVSATYLPDASTSAQGVVQLSTSTSSTSTTLAATPSAVKVAYDTAVAAQGYKNTSYSGNKNVTVSTSNPSGGTNGDIWLKY